MRCLASVFSLRSQEEYEEEDVKVVVVVVDSRITGGRMLYVVICNIISLVLFG
jgi:hypothetical protein